MFTSNFPLVSVIILNFNGSAYLGSCLSSVLKTYYPNFEIILVDNNSTDGSNDIISKFSEVPNLTIVLNDHNVGPAEGYNIGSKHAKGEYLAFLNNDIEVDPNWLSELVKVMENTPDAGAAGCKQLLLKNRSMMDDIGGYIDAYGFVYQRCRHGEIDYGQYDDSIATVFRYGETALIVRRNVFENIGGFDSKYFMWYEDNDLCWRIHLSGHKIISVPSAVIYHAVSGSVSKIPKPQSFYLNERNRIITLIKNYEYTSLFKTLPILLILEIGLIILFLLKGKTDYAVSIIRALKDVMFDDDIWERRRKVQEIRKIPDKLLFKRFVRFKFKLIIERLRQI